MKIFLKFSIVIMLATQFSCKSTSKSYFKLSITNELMPDGLLPENIEINSNGKLVILTNRFNENNEIYQRTFFAELNKVQRDSVNFFIKKFESHNHSKISEIKYIAKLEQFINDNRSSKVYLGSELYGPIKELNNYCHKILLQNKRHALNHSYYFATDNICIKPGSN